MLTFLNRLKLLNLIALLNLLKLLKLIKLLNLLELHNDIADIAEIGEIAEITLKLSQGNQIPQNPRLKQKCLPPRAAPAPGPQEVAYDHVTSRLVKILHNNLEKVGFI